MNDEQRIEIPAKGDFPALMIFSEKMLSAAVMAYIRQSIDRYYETGKVSIFEPGLKVFQCLSGVWTEINPAPKPEPEFWDVLKLDQASLELLKFKKVESPKLQNCKPITNFADLIDIENASLPIEINPAPKPEPQGSIPVIVETEWFELKSADPNFPYAKMVASEAKKVNFREFT